MSEVKLELSWGDVWQRAIGVARSLLSATKPNKGEIYIYGVPRGGIHAATLVYGALADRNDHSRFVLSVNPDNADIFIDDIIDSGKTERFYKEKYGKPFYALVDKDEGTFLHDTWITFPWERMQNEQGVEDNITRILQYIGEDPKRPGLLETPKRVIKSYGELFAGYKMKAEDVIKTFENEGKYDEMISVYNIPFTSMCEHHMLPFSGVVHAAYIPDATFGKILGLSKFARLVEVFARRLQVQERMTAEIAAALNTGLTPLGTAVVVEAAHSCMECRGVRVHGTTTTTSSMLGAFRDNKENARHEFLQLIPRK